MIIGELHHVHGHIEKVLHLMKNILRSEDYFLSFEPTSNNVIYRAIREHIYQKIIYLMPKQNEDLSILNYVRYLMVLALKK